MYRLSHDHVRSPDPVRSSHVVSDPRSTVSTRRHGFVATDVNVRSAHKPHAEAWTSFMHLENMEVLTFTFKSRRPRVMRSKYLTVEVALMSCLLCHHSRGVQGHSFVRTYSEPRVNERWVPGYTLLSWVDQRVTMTRGLSAPPSQLKQCHSEAGSSGLLSHCSLRSACFSLAR